MDEVFYRIADAARILKIKEHNFHDAGSMGKLPIYVCSSIFNLFYLKVTVGPDDVEDYFNESEIQAPWNENTRLPSPEHMQLSTTCLKRYFAGDLEAKVVPKPDIENGNLLIRFGLYNSDKEPLKVKDVNLLILAKDLYKIQSRLKARQGKNSNPNKNINNETDSCIDDTESSKKTSAIIDQKDCNADIDSTDVTETNTGIQKVKKRKKLLPMQRETSEGLVLIYDLLEHYNIGYLDELSGMAAWGRVVSAEYEHDSIEENKKTYIIFDTGTKLLRTEFLEKYRKRFKTEI